MNLLNSINWTGNVLIVIAVLAVLAIVFTTVILIISKVCHVESNPKIEEVKDKLAGANCGACGFAGCADFAKALVEGKADLSACSATSADGKNEIAGILGTTVGQTTPKIAVIKCRGDNDTAKKRFLYVGMNSCQAKNNALSGDKVCYFGCLGEGSCVSVCKFGAINVENGLAKTIPEKCTGCGACAKFCSKAVIELIPSSAKVYVACNTKCKGKEVINACSFGCIGCGLCAKNCPNGAITITDNLPVIDYSKCTGCEICLNKCPRHTICKI